MKLFVGLLRNEGADMRDISLMYINMRLRHGVKMTREEDEQGIFVMAKRNRRVKSDDRHDDILFHVIYDFDSKCFLR